MSEMVERVTLAPKELTYQEQSCARLAASVISEAGGSVTFDEYDNLMLPRHYFRPFNWVAGWGLSRADQKANSDKMCVFAACKMGLVIRTNTGYRSAI